MVAILDGFTQDVVTLVGIADEGSNNRMRDAVRRIQNPQERIEFLRSGLMDVLSPFMQMAPPFLQSIVARAILDYVDWDAVIERIMTDPKNN